VNRRTLSGMTVKQPRTLVEAQLPRREASTASNSQAMKVLWEPSRNFFVLLTRRSRPWTGHVDRQSLDGPSCRCQGQGVRTRLGLAMGCHQKRHPHDARVASDSLLPCQMHGMMPHQRTPQMTTEHETSVLWESPSFSHSVAKVPEALVDVSTFS